MELTLHADQFVDRLHHVDGNADRSRLVRDRPGDRLANPPCRVRGELVALRVIEFLHGADQSEIAFLDEIQEQHSAAHVTLGDRDHEPEVGLDEPLLGAHALPDEVFELRPGESRGEAFTELVLGEQPGLDGLGQFHLLLGGEQGNPADLPQVDPDQVTRRSPFADVLLVRLAGFLVPLWFEDLNPVLGEHPHDALQRVGRQLGSVERGGHVVNRDAPAFPSLRDEVRHLICRWRPAWQHRCTHATQCAGKAPLNGRPIFVTQGKAKVNTESRSKYMFGDCAVWKGRLFRLRSRVPATPVAAVPAPPVRRTAGCTPAARRPG